MSASRLKATSDEHATAATATAATAVPGAGVWPACGAAPVQAAEQGCGATCASPAMAPKAVHAGACCCSQMGMRMHMFHRAVIGLSNCRSVHPELWRSM